MNTVQINKIMSVDVYTKNIYLGTFSIDTLPIKVKYPSCLILNNQKSFQEGEHWIAIYFNANKTADFFDSFAHHPRNFGLENYLKFNAKSYEYNKTKLQSNLSSNCGYYCILFLLLKARNKEMIDYINLFKNPMANDEMIEKMIKLF